MKRVSASWLTLSVWVCVVLVTLDISAQAAARGDLIDTTEQVLYALAILKSVLFTA